MGFSMKDWRAQRRKRMLQKAEAEEQVAEKEEEKIVQLTADEMQLEAAREKYRVDLAGRMMAEEKFIRQLGDLEQKKYTIIRAIGRFAQAGQGLINAGRAISSGIVSRGKRIKTSLKAMFARAVLGGIMPDAEKAVDHFVTEQRNNIIALEKDVQMQINENRAELARYKSIAENAIVQGNVLKEYETFIAAQLNEIRKAVANVEKEIADEGAKLAAAKRAAEEEAVAAKEAREAMFTKTG